MARRLGGWCDGSGWRGVPAADGRGGCEEVDRPVVLPADVLGVRDAALEAEVVHLTAVRFERMALDRAAARQGARREDAALVHDLEERLLVPVAFGEHDL